MDHSLTYLVCPLNWGLGHASRMIPIVYALLQKGNKVILGGDGDALKLISSEFPHLKTIQIPDIKVRFHPNSMLFSLLNIAFQILFSSLKEHQLLKRLINSNSIDVIISDNRYGLWNRKIKSILLTHQTMIKLPKPFTFAEFATHLLVQELINKFNECWIPDYADQDRSLSGDLSHKYKTRPNTRFIGPLSRFNYVDAIPTKQTYDIVAVLSGPEPMRTQLEKELTKVFLTFKQSALIVQGKPQEKAVLKNQKNVHFTAHMPASQLKFLLSNTKLYICRSGYSSIMDLSELTANALLIPTPGQTEQEYLARHLQDRWKVLPQNKIATHLPSILNNSLLRDK